MKSENDDKKIVAQHIYTYYHNKRKKAVMRNEKVTVTTKDAEEWLFKIDGKESITILKKALELANGQDSVPIVIDNNSELRMLFMTGNGYKDRENNANQKEATRKARLRFEDLKNRGYFNGSCNNFWVTLYGKEYVLSATNKSTGNLENG